MSVIMDENDLFILEMENFCDIFTIVCSVLPYWLLLPVTRKHYLEIF